MRGAARGQALRMTSLPMARNTAAFYAQAAIAFAVSAAGAGIGIAYLPIDRWQRAFLGMTLLFVVSSAFTLAKCIRDQQEAQQRAEETRGRAWADAA